MPGIERIFFRGWWARMLSAAIQIFSIAAAFFILDDPNFVSFSFLVGIGFLGGQIFGGGWGRKISSAHIYSGAEDVYFDEIRSYFSAKMCVLVIALVSVPICFWLNIAGSKIIIFYNYFFLSLFIGAGLFCAEILKATRYFLLSFLFERSLPPVLILCAFLMGVYPSHPTFFIYPLIYTVFFYLLISSFFFKRPSIIFSADGYLGFRHLWGARTFIISAVSDSFVYRTLPLALPFSLYSSDSSAGFIFIASALNFLNLFFDAKALSFFKSLKCAHGGVAPDLYSYYKDCFFSFYIIMVAVIAPLAFLALEEVIAWEYLFYIGILQINSLFLSLSFCPIYFLQGSNKANIISTINVGYFGIAFAFLFFFPNAHIGWLGLTLGVGSLLRFCTFNFYAAYRNFK